MKTQDREHLIYLAKRKITLVQQNRSKFFIPNGKQEEFAEAPAFVNIFSAGNGIGKCLPLDSPILMADGSYKQLKDIKIGDYVLGHDYDSGIAKPSRVLQTSRAGKKTVYKINFKGGGFVIASKEHSFPVKYKSGRQEKAKKVKLEKLLKRKVNCVGSRLKFIQPKRVVFDNKIEIPLDPYLIGTLIGDGCLVSSRVGLTNNNKDLLVRVQKIVNKYHCVLKRVKNNDYNIINIKKSNSNPILDEIRKLKLNVLSGDKFIPHIYKIASVEDRLQLLAGLIDTDGYKNGYTTKSKRLADDFMFLVKSLGGFATSRIKIVNNSFTKYEDKGYYAIYWRFDYKLPLSCDYKQHISKKPIDYSNRFVESIEEHGEVECGDIYIEHPKHCYISYDFISTGNTCLGVNMLIKVLYGPQNKFFEKPFYINHKRPLRARIMSDPTVVDTKIVPELKKWLPKGTYETEKRRKPYEAYWKITKGPGKGSIFDILTYNQDSSEFEAVELDYAWGDEPPPRELFTPTIRGFRFGGTFVITMTPLRGAGFLFEQLDEIEQLNDQGLARPRRKIVFGSVRDNCKEHGVRGILEHDNIEQIVAEYDEEEKMARIEGKPMYQSGVVYKRFGDIHVIPTHRVPEKATLYMALDPHDAKPSCFIWAYVNIQGEIVIYRELAIKKPIPEIIKEVKELERGEFIKERIIDAYFGKKPYGNTGLTVKDSYYDEGKKLRYKMSFIDGPSGPGCLEAGHELVRQRLYYDATKEISGNNFPSIFIMDCCPITGKSMRNYKYKEVAIRAKEYDGVGANVGEKWKDFCDDVRFIVQSRPRYYPQNSEILDMNLIDPIIDSATGY